MFSPQNQIGVGASILYSILGFAIVFVMLIILMAMICVVSYIMKRSSRSMEKTSSSASPAKAATEEVPAPVAQVTQEVVLTGVSDQEAAMIMAIVANATEKPLDLLRFHYIKEVSQK